MKWEAAGFWRGGGACFVRSRFRRVGESYQSAFYHECQCVKSEGELHTLDGVGRGEKGGVRVINAMCIFSQ